MRNTYPSLKGLLPLVFYIWCGFGQLKPPVSLSSSSSSLLHQNPSTSPSKSLENPAPSTFPSPVGDFANVRFINGLPHASSRESLRGDLPIESTPTRNGTFYRSNHTNPTSLTASGRPNARLSSTSRLTASPNVTDAIVNGIAPTNATPSKSHPGVAFGSFLALTSDRARSGIPALPSGYIRATGGILFGSPSMNSTSVSLTNVPQSLITLPPAPPLRFGGLNLTGIRIVRVSNLALSTNTSITTVSPGGSQPTVVPVIMKAAGVGLAVFGLSAAVDMGSPLFEIGQAAEVAEEEAAGEDEEEEDEQQKTGSLTSASSQNPSTSDLSSTTPTSSSSSSSVSNSASSHSLSSSTSGSTEACSIPTDYPVIGDPEDYGVDDQVPDSKAKRFTSGGAIIGRRYYQQSGNQGLGEFTNQKAGVTRLGKCSLDEVVNIPPFWKANSIIGKSGNSQTWYMPVPEDPNNLDALPTYTTAATPALRTLSPQRKNVIIGGSSGPRTNVDHVYEVSLLKNFFNYYLAQRSVCRDFNGELMSNSSAHEGATRLSVIFAQLPGVDFGGLAGMDQRLNSIKAYFFQAGAIQKGLGYPAKSICDAIKDLQLAGMAMDMLHSPELQRFFNDANSRIYQALLGADKAIGADASVGCNKWPKKGFSWAGEYKLWIDWFLSEREAEIQYWAGSTQNAISNKLNEKLMKLNQIADGGHTTDPQYNDDRKRMSAFLKSPYGKPSHWSFNFNLQYPSNALPMAKRGDGSSCANPSHVSSSTFSTSFTASTRAATASGVAMQPGTASDPGSTAVHFIENGAQKAGSAPVGGPESAEKLNNEQSANEFNNDIQRIGS